jgi:hypothetical protein
MCLESLFLCSLTPHFKKLVSTFSPKEILVIETQWGMLERK